MPMLTTLRIGLPVWPRPLAARGPARRRRAIRSSISWTSLTTSTPSTISERSRGIRSATWSTARSSETLMCSPANIASRRSCDAALARRASPSSTQRLVGDPVLRVVEVEAGAVGDEPLAALRVAGEEVAQVAVARARRGGARAPPRPASRSGRSRADRSAACSRSSDSIDSSSSCQDLSKASLALLLEPGGQRVDVDPGLGELGQDPLGVAAVGGQRLADLAVVGEREQRLLGHRVDRERRREAPRRRGRRRRRGPWSRCWRRAAAAAARPRSARRCQRSESSSSR